MATDGNIFLLEFIVDDLYLWTLPEHILESDESCIDFKFLDNIRVSICEREFGFTTSKNGKNCLFTTDTIGEENQITVEVYKKPCQCGRIFVGQGVIPIYDIFKNVFDLCFPCEEEPITPLQQPSKVSSRASSMGVKSGKSGSGENTAKRLGAGGSNFLSIISSNKSNEQTNYLSIGEHPTSQPLANLSATFPDFITVYENYRPDDVQTGVNRLGAGGGGAINEGNEDGMDAATSECSHTTDGSESVQEPQIFPISDISKGLYPILYDSDRVGVAVILLRLTCFGKTIISPFQIDQNRCCEMVIQSEKESDRMRCSKMVEEFESECRPKLKKKKTKPQTVPCDDIFDQLAKRYCYCGQSEEKVQRKSSSSSPPCPNKDKETKKCACPPNDQQAHQPPTQPKRCQCKPPQCGQSSQQQQPQQPPCPMHVQYMNELNACDCFPMCRGILSGLQGIPEESEHTVINTDTSLDSNDKPYSTPSQEEDSDLCPCPPGSTTELAPEYEFDEYVAEMNQNALIIRVLKNSKTVTQVVEDEEGNENEAEFFDGKQAKKIAFHCTEDGENVKVEVPGRKSKIVNTCGIPLIKGNLKYPSSYGASFQIPSCKSASEKYRIKQSKAPNCCFQCNGNELDFSSEELAQAVPPGIEVCRKTTGSSSNDIFILKLGKRNDKGSSSQIEVELRTPKSPFANRGPKQTRACQTYEEEFEEPFVPRILFYETKPSNVYVGSNSNFNTNKKKGKKR